MLIRFQDVEKRDLLVSLGWNGGYVQPKQEVEHLVAEIPGEATPYSQSCRSPDNTPQDVENLPVQFGQ